MVAASESTAQRSMAPPHGVCRQLRAPLPQDKVEAAKAALEGERGALAERAAATDAKDKELTAREKKVRQVPRTPLATPARVWKHGVSACGAWPKSAARVSTSWKTRRGGFVVWLVHAWLRGGVGGVGGAAAA